MFCCDNKRLFEKRFGTFFGILFFLQTTGNRISNQLKEELAQTNCKPDADEVQEHKWKIVVASLRKLKFQKELV